MPTGGEPPTEGRPPAKRQTAARSEAPAEGQAPAGSRTPPEHGTPAGDEVTVAGSGVPAAGVGGAPGVMPGAGGVGGEDGSRPAFRPRVIRTARDAVTTAALYLRWLGYRDIRRADQRPPSGIGLAAHGLLAQVDPTVRPAAPRDVECLWLTAMTEDADCVYFSLAGYTDDARLRAAALAVPLFVLDLAGVPQPMNDAAQALHTEGAPERGTRARDGRT
ncbi:hypothetical protein [Streptomyces sp. NPDC048665]|uniref:hypothetical protein n=1 Tax=Streptomyces sp. NPDC048665 TaxID=3155490 RepID=UPI0034357F5C